MELIVGVSFVVVLCNCWLAPNDVRIKAKGFEDYPFNRFKKIFGINFGKLEYEEKLLFCEFILDTYSLDVWDTSNLLPVSILHSVL